MINLPNILTMANLFLGCCAFLLIFQGKIEAAAWCTAGSFLCDYLDGMVARALKTNSPLGKELDSLADVVSFGVVPGALIYWLLKNSIFANLDGGNFQNGIVPMALVGFILSTFSALRLAKFNLDTRQANYFIGLSTPACTLLVVGLALTANSDRFGLAGFIQNTYFLMGLTAVLSWLLISEIPMFGMKIKHLDVKSNLPVLLAVAVAAVLFYFLKELALSVLVVFYIVFSIIFKNKIIANS